VAELERRGADLTARLETVEARIAAIDALFCSAGYYESTPAGDVAAVQAERDALQAESESLLADWTQVEEELEQLRGSVAAARS
jgi:hypothetical protein